MIEWFYWNVNVTSPKLGSFTSAGSLKAARESARRTKEIFGPDAKVKITRIRVKRTSFCRGAAVAFGLMGMAEAIRGPLCCEVCGEAHDPQRVYGEVEICRLCLASQEYRVEQLTTILQQYGHAARPMRIGRNLRTPTPQVDQEEKPEK